MTISEQLQFVRKAVKSSFSQLSTTIMDSCLETVLMKGDFYVGHRFRYKELIAEWFLDKDEIEIKSAEGQLLAVVAVNGSQELNKAA